MQQDGNNSHSVSPLNQNIALGEAKSDSIKGQNCDGQKINVVSFVNPDDEIESVKKSLDDIPSFAMLSNEPRAALPESFTIISYQDKCLLFPKC